MEKVGDVEPAIKDALAFDGPALVDVVVNADEPPMPAKIHYDEAKEQVIFDGKDGLAEVYQVERRGEEPKKTKAQKIIYWRKDDSTWGDIVRYCFKCLPAEQRHYLRVNY